MQMLGANTVCRAYQLLALEMSASELHNMLRLHYQEWKAFYKEDS